MLKKYIMLFVLIALMCLSVSFTVYANAETYTQSDEYYYINFDRSDWTSIKNTSSNPLGSFSGTYSNINVGLHDEGIEMQLSVSNLYLIQVGYSSGSMQWGNDITFTLGSSSDLPAYWSPNLIVGESYSISSLYQLTVSGYSFTFPFTMNFSFVEVSDTVVNMNYTVTYSYLYMQPLSQYGVALPKTMVMSFIGKSALNLNFSYLTDSYNMTSFNRTYNLGSTFGSLPTLPYTPTFALSYYWAYEDSISTPITVDTVVADKNIVAVYSINPLMLTSDVLSKLQDYYDSGYDAGLVEGSSTPAGSLEALVSGVSTAMNIDIFGAFSLMDLVSISIGLGLLIWFFKSFGG